MNIDPDIAKLVTSSLAVNSAALLVLAVLSYFGSALALNGLAWLDRKLNPSHREEPPSNDGLRDQG